MALALAAIPLLILPPGVALALVCGGATLVWLMPALRQASGSINGADLFDFHGWL